MNSRSTPDMTPSKKPRLAVPELVTFALIAALAFGGQVVMAPLPNIEPVTVIFMACAVVYGWKSLFPLYVFVLLEGLVWGFNVWFVNYLYVWPVLIIVTVLLRRFESRALYAAIAGAFGLFFGALCALLYIFIGGWEMALAYWVAGIPFDLIHCVSNAILAFLLMPAMVKLLRMLNGNGLPR